MNGKKFMLFKFRSMKVMEAGNTIGLRQATRDDSRVTPIGKFLRRWSLDELPQLVNILRGEMSLIGPRPVTAAEVNRYGSAYPFYGHVHLSGVNRGGQAVYRLRPRAV